MTSKPPERFHIDRLATPIDDALIVTDDAGIYSTTRAQHSAITRPVPPRWRRRGASEGAATYARRATNVPFG
jgi:hypothetical protein